MTAEQRSLLDLILDLGQPPSVRAEAGRKLNDWGDPRPGVSLRQDRLPDIAWCQAAESYSISKYLITGVQYEAFVIAEDGYSNDLWWQEPSRLALRVVGPGKSTWSIANHPVQNVSWYDAVAFARWLTAKLQATGELGAGNGVRLPTAFEWWQAATGEDRSRHYPWGLGYRIGFANVDETNSGEGSSFLKQTTSVGLYPHAAAPCGAMDMSGNVSEWTLTEYSSKRSDDLTNTQPRMVCGGSWLNAPAHARTSSRTFGFPDYRYYNVGFRLLREVSRL